MTSNLIKTSIVDGIGTITFNRTEKMNAFTGPMMMDFVEALDELDNDDAARAVIVTGEGRAFCAGADISGGASGFTDIGNPDSEGADGKLNYASESARDGGGFITLRLFDMKKPVIGAVNGAAVGMGSSMLLPMDYRIASETAKFGFVFARRGICMESTASYFLPRLVGVAQALDWSLTGRVFKAEEALQGGMISQILPPENLIERAHEIAHNIIDNTAPVSVALNRQMIWRGLGLDHPMEAHKIESRGVLSTSRAADAAEGVASFLEKRPADFPLRVSKDMPDFYPWWTDRKYS